MENHSRVYILTILLAVFISGCVQTPTGAFLESENVDCFPMWSCDDWSECSLIDGRWVQSRLCNDVNNCNSETNKPIETQDCEPPITYEARIGETFSQCGLEVKLDYVTVSKNITYINSDKNLATLILNSDEYFVVPYVEITNNFKHSIKASFNDFTLEDEEGQTFKPRCPSQTINDFEACQTGDEWHFGSRYIETGQSIKGNLIFFVPQESSELRVLYKMPLLTYDCRTVDTTLWRI